MLNEGVGDSAELLNSGGIFVGGNFSDAVLGSLSCVHLVLGEIVKFSLEVVVEDTDFVANGFDRVVIVASISVDLSVQLGVVFTWDKWIVVGVSIVARKVLLNFVADLEDSLIEPVRDIIAEISKVFLGCTSVIPEFLVKVSTSVSKVRSASSLVSNKLVEFINFLLNEKLSFVSKASLEEHSEISDGIEEVHLL